MMPAIIIFCFFACLAALVIGGRHIIAEDEKVN